MPDDVLGTCRRHEHDGSRRDADIFGDGVVCMIFERASWIVGPCLGHDDDVLAGVGALVAERDHVAGADVVDATDDLFDVLGVDVAATDDDDVLDATTHHDLTVDGVRQVAACGASTGEQLVGGLGALVVAERE